LRAGVLTIQVAKFGKSRLSWSSGLAPACHTVSRPAHTVTAVARGGPSRLWAGDSQGFKHVRVRLPGMAGSTAQLRFEFTQDAIATCSDVRPGHTCGVMFDNLVVKSVKSVVP